MKAVFEYPFSSKGEARGSTQSQMHHEPPNKLAFLHIAKLKKHYPFPTSFPSLTVSDTSLPHAITPITLQNHH